MSEFQVKDSGARERYASGMERDTTEGKPDYTLIPLEFLERWAWHMTKGAVKYGRDNWRLAAGAEELTRFEGSALRHMMQWLRGDRSEDHASAVAFNVAAAEYVRGKIAEAQKPEVMITVNDRLTPELERNLRLLLAREMRVNGLRGFR